MNSWNDCVREDLDSKGLTWHWWRKCPDREGWKGIIEKLLQQPSPLGLEKRVISTRISINTGRKSGLGISHKGLPQHALRTPTWSAGRSRSMPGSDEAL